MLFTNPGILNCLKDIITKYLFFKCLYYAAIAHMTKHVAGKFRALGNIGDCLLRLGEVDEAIKMHQRQLNLARQAADRSLEAAAYGALGVAHRATRNLDKALGFHTQELTLRQEAADLGGECRAHGNLGAVHMALGQYTHAVKCYQEQLERARELGDSGVEAQALGNKNRSCIFCYFHSSNLYTRSGFLREHSHHLCVGCFDTKH